MDKITEEEFFRYCRQFDHELGCILGKKENSELLTEGGIGLFEESLIRDILDFNMHSIDGISTSNEFVAIAYTMVKISLQRIIRYNNDKNDTIIFALDPKTSEEEWEKYKFEEERIEGKIQHEMNHAYSVIENVLGFINASSLEQKKDIEMK